eukprot:TRINITY_DN4054_c1_g1_i2.p1 TRINITY_DN4054_c1_g1~~TRINITY_DN4054_c1_g1_i2.p1  ORF type:complete len:720 (-),score=209.36 TRINITY_DN4054_c1_g1_i2:229-2388(-)
MPQLYTKQVSRSWVNFFLPPSLTPLSSLSFFPYSFSYQRPVKLWSPWERLGGQMTSHPSVGVNLDGALEVFYRGVDNALYHLSQIGPNGKKFTPPKRIGSARFKLASRPVVGTQSDGRLAVFAYSVYNSSLYYTTQLAPANTTTTVRPNWGKGEWQALGGKWRGTPAVATNKDGTLVVFTRSQDGHLFHIRQKIANGKAWHYWRKQGGQLLGDPQVATNMDGSLSVFVRAVNNAVYYTTQREVDGYIWEKWVNLGGSLSDDPSVLVKSDGSLEVFARWTDNTAYHRWQVGGSKKGWSEWKTLGGSLTSNPTVIVRKGMSELYAIGNDNAVVFKSQTIHIEWKWSPWADLQGRLMGKPVTILNSHGRIEAFARGPGNALYYSFQKELSKTQVWAEWRSLGGEIMGDPTVVRLKNGALQIFAQGFDNSLWTSKQATPDRPDSWSKLVRIGSHVVGGVISAPSVVVNRKGLLEVFARGIDNELVTIYEKRDGKSKKITWSDWRSLGGKLEAAPVARRDKWGRINVFTRSTGNNVRYLQENQRFNYNNRDNQWQRWREISGLTIDFRPEVARLPDGRLAVYAIDLDHRMRMSFQESPKGFSAWQRVGFEKDAAAVPNTRTDAVTFMGPPAIARDHKGRHMVVARGADSHIYGCSQLPDKWSPWTRIVGAQVESDPAVISYPNGVMMILGRGVQNNLLSIQYGIFLTDQEKDWTKFKSLGGRLG